MTPKYIFECMSKLRPNNTWHLYEKGNPIPEQKIENVVWNSNDVTTPTMEEIQEYYENTYKKEKLFEKIRNERDKLLKSTDRYTIPDWPHSTDEAKQAWLDYRQALRDLPANTTDPENPAWPTPPE
jgi:hypothetical protein